MSQEMRSRSLFLVAFALPPMTVLAVACSAKHSDSSNIIIDDGGTEPLDAARRDGGSKPPPATPKDASTRDVAPPHAEAGQKPQPATDAGRLVDAGLDPDAGFDAAATATPLDPVDESFMPQYGQDLGQCTDVNLTASTGFCRASASGEDYVEGCAGTEAYLLDCQRYETPGSYRSICTDDRKTNVGCALFSVNKVDSFEQGQTTNAWDLFHACPTSWEGYGYCSGNYVYMCVGGRDYALDCTIYNTGSFTYTCKVASDTSKISCQ